jgi:hypothetical protein
MGQSPGGRGGERYCVDELPGGTTWKALATVGWSAGVVDINHLEANAPVRLLQPVVNRASFSCLM